MRSFFLISWADEPVDLAVSITMWPDMPGHSFACERLMHGYSPIRNRVGALINQLYINMLFMYTAISLNVFLHNGRFVLISF